MSGDLSFWARRKAGVQAEGKADEAALEQQALADQHAELDGKTDAEVLETLDLPDPDTLTQGDDFKAFMAKAVPDRIRRRALRALWRSNPVLANVDMLVDYGEDFTDSAMVIENMQTAYQVGKGMLKHVEEMTRQAEVLENPPEEIEELKEDDVLVVSEDEEIVGLFADVEPTGDEDETYVAPTPRRMKFTIEESAA